MFRPPTPCGWGALRDYSYKKTRGPEISFPARVYTTRFINLSASGSLVRPGGLLSIRQLLNWRFLLLFRLRPLACFLVDCKRVQFRRPRIYRLIKLVHYILPVNPLVDMNPRIFRPFYRVLTHFSCPFTVAGFQPAFFLLLLLLLISLLRRWGIQVLSFHYNIFSFAISTFF
jgi:hypothetical protein